jgi:hypothetical protein
VTSRRDRLRDRALPTTAVPLPVDPVAHALAQAQLERAENALAVAHARQVPDLEVHQRAVQLAEDALAALPVEVFQLRCLPPQRWDELVEAHPPTDEQRRAGWSWNVTTFRPVVLEACVLTPDGDEPLTARHWVEVAEEGEMRVGELELLFAEAVQLNARQPRLDLGKG